MEDDKIRWKKTKSSVKKTSQDIKKKKKKKKHLIVRVALAALCER